MIVLVAALCAVLFRQPQASLSSVHALPTTLAGETTQSEVIPLGTGTSYRFKGLAVDSTGGRFFLGSWDQRQIVAVSRTRPRVTTFASPFQRRLAGMGVFLRGSRLYALMNEVDDAPDARPESVLLVFDIETGTLLHSYSVRGSAEGRHHFNHVVVSADGRAFISNTLKSGIWTVQTDNPSDSLRPFLIDARLRLLHGIALGPSDERLFVTSYETGLGVVDLRTRRLTSYGLSESRGTDGIQYYRGSVYGIGQNALTRYRLSADEGQVTDSNVLLANHPTFNDPRCLTVLGDDLFILANIEHTAVTFRDPGRRGVTLADTHVLKYRLPRD